MSGGVDVTEDATGWTSKERYRSLVPGNQVGTSDSPLNRKTLKSNKDCPTLQSHVTVKIDSNVSQADTTIKRTEASSSTDILCQNGQKVSPRYVSSGKFKYQHLVSPVAEEVSFSRTVSPLMTIETGIEHSSLQKQQRAAPNMGQLPSSSNPSRHVHGEGALQRTGSSDHVIPYKHGVPSKSTRSHRWSEQGIRLASFVEDSIYQSLKSNDEAAVKQWQITMSEERKRNGTDGRKSKECHEPGSLRGKMTSKNPHYQPKSSEVPLNSSHSLNKGEHSIPPKDGKFSLLDALQEKLKHALLNYGQSSSPLSTTINTADQFGTLFFSPVVDSTVQSSEATSSTNEEIASNSTKDGVPSSSASLTSKQALHGVGRLSEKVNDSAGSPDEALDLSRSSGVSRLSGISKSRGLSSIQEPEPGEPAPIPSNKTFTLERILHPSTKGSKKPPVSKPMNPFMRTFSDLLDLPPREIKNRDPFKVKRRPYRRKFGSPAQNGSTPFEENGEAEDDTSRDTHSPSFVLNSTDMQPGPSGSTDTSDWPSVALLMNVYQEWEKKKALESSKDQSSDVPLDESSQSSFSGDQTDRSKDEPSHINSSAVSVDNPSHMNSSVVTSSFRNQSSQSKSCSCAKQSKQHRSKHFTKKSRLLEKVERSRCQCQSSVAAPPGDHHVINPTSIRSLLSTDRSEKRKHSGAGEDRTKRCRLDGNDEGHPAGQFIAAGGEGQAAHACIIS